MEEDVADLSSIAWWEVVPRSEGRGEEVGRVSLLLLLWLSRRKSGGPECCAAFACVFQSPVVVAGRASKFQPHKPHIVPVSTICPPTWQ